MQLLKGLYFAAMKNILGKMGPATMVAAAFIGPGTIVTCSVAGASFGFALIWAIIFSAITTLVLQEMAGRLGIVKRMGLGEALHNSLERKSVRIVVAALIIISIGMGNAAYQSGNITGAALGGSMLLETENHAIWIIIFSAIAFYLLYLGRYKVLEKTLVALVFVMSIVFVVTALYVQVDLTEVLKGIFIPAIPEGSQLVIVALIGTTVVPYNLFLHSAATASKWNGDKYLSTMRKDSAISILIGGFISACIIITSGATLFLQGIPVASISDLTGQMTPLLGNLASSLFAMGILAAGLTSVITAPLAAAYAISGVLHGNVNMRSSTFRASWMVVLITGLIVALLGIKPITLIQLAQASNGLMLPIVGIFLLIIMNHKSLGNHRNKWFSNTVGTLVLTIIGFLGVRAFLLAFNLL